jgi:predicted SAM-dependent methyltransferase
VPVSDGKRLHIGCGDEALPEWINIDAAPYPAVDVVQDVTKAIPFTNCSYIFAEHFIEHLSLEQARSFLSLCRRALANDGVLRLTTPNLDWVYATQYRPAFWASAAEAVEDCLRLNRSFYGWGHQFLYNRDTLANLLREAGFETVESCARGESRHSNLRGLERHEPYPDSSELPHILILEASGRSSEAAPVALGMFKEYRRDTEMPFHQIQYAALSFVRLLKRALGRQRSGK